MWMFPCSFSRVVQRIALEIHCRDPSHRQWSAGRRAPMMPAGCRLDGGRRGRGHYWTGAALQTSLWTYGRSFAVVHRDSWFKIHVLNLIYLWDVPRSQMSACALHIRARTVWQICFRHNIFKNYPQGLKKNSLEGHATRFSTICAKSQALN
jgi:hypothetical protein